MAYGRDTVGQMFAYAGVCFMATSLGAGLLVLVASSMKHHRNTAFRTDCLASGGEVAYREGSRPLSSAAICVRQQEDGSWTRD